MADRLAATINGLPLFPPGQCMCPFDDGKALTLTFRAQAAGPQLAVATVDLNGCADVDLAIGGKPAVELGPVGAGATLGPELLKIAGLRWKLRTT